MNHLLFLEMLPRLLSLLIRGLLPLLQLTCGLMLLGLPRQQVIRGLDPEQQVIQGLEPQQQILGGLDPHQQVLGYQRLVHGLILPLHQLLVPLAITFHKLLVRLEVACHQLLLVPLEVLHQLLRFLDVPPPKILRCLVVLSGLDLLNQVLGRFLLALRSNHQPLLLDVLS